MFGLENKLTLYGFNNLTKTLSFNIYDVCYAKSERAQKDYVAYIDEQYNSERLTRILCDVTEIIGAHVLNISKQDYEPQGASVTLLISENDMPEEMMDKSCNHGHLASRDTVLAHLDKSHVTVHTYPEYHPDNSISTFRVDIDVATCGEISPLNALDYLIPISLLPITACVDLHVIIMEINYLLTMILLPFKIISPRKRCKSMTQLILMYIRRICFIQNC